MKMKYEDVFGLYNFVGNIFRANLDENDRAAQKVTKKYQDTGVISEEEEKWVKKWLNPETKRITKPYTKIIKEDEFKVYLVEKSKLLSSDPHFINSINTPVIFGDCGVKNIILVNKDLFLLQDMHDNEKDKLLAISYYSNIFNLLLFRYNQIKDYYDFNTQLPDLLGLLFYYQVSGFKLTEKEYIDIKTSYFKEKSDNEHVFFPLSEDQLKVRLSSEERKHSEIFKIMEDIIRIGEIENIGIPLIPENMVTQNNIAMEINDRLGWMIAIMQQEAASRSVFVGPLRRNNDTI